MKLREYVKAGIGFAIGMTIVTSIVKVINDGVDNELKRISKEFEETEPTEENKEEE